MTADTPAGPAPRIKRRRAVRPVCWCAWLTAAAAAGLGLTHYRIDNDLRAWAPSVAPAGLAHSYAVVGFERSGVDDRAVADALRRLPTVSFCIDRRSLAGADRVVDATAEDFVVGTDGTYVGVYAFRKDAADDAGFLRDIRRCLARFGRGHVVDAEAPRGEPAGRGGVAAPGGVHAARSGGSAATRFALAGPAVFRAALNEATQRRLSVIMVLIVLTGGLLLWWITGRPSTAAAAMAAIVLSQIMLMGLVGWSGVAVDMSLSMVPPLMMALGFSYAAHHALRPGTGGVLVLCLATTALGIGGFAASGLPAVRTFAVYGVLGLVLVWLAVVMLVPIPAPRGRAPARRDVWLRRARGHTLAGIRRRGHAVTIIAVGVTVAAVAAIPRLRLGMNPLNYFSRSARIVRDADVLNRRLTGTLPFEVVVSRGDPTPVLMRTPGIRKVIDVTRLTPGAGDTYWVLADADALPGIVAHRDAWRRWADTAGATLSWRGVAAAIHAAGRGLRTVAAITIPMMVLIAAAVVGVMTRSLRQAGISAWVNLLPVAGLIIAMAVTGRPIELPSLMIGAISVGVAVDDTIHLTWVLARSRSVAHAMVTCWRPCVGSSLVAAWCMALFVLAPFGPTRQFGALLALAIGVALLADLLLLPVLSRGRRTPAR